MKALRNTAIADEQDDIAQLYDAIRRAVEWLVLGVLAATFASVGALLYVALSGRASAGPEAASIEKRIEILGGQCQVEPIGSGIWYQDEYPHRLDLRAACFQVSVSKILAHRRGWDLGLRFGYADLGTTRMDSEFAVLDQEQHLVPDGSGCNPATFSGCKARGRSAQRARGFTLGGLAERAYRGTRLGAEAGLFLYSGTFDVSIDVHGMPRPTRWDLHFQGAQISPYLGASLQYGNALLLARVYTLIRAAEHGCGGCSGFSSGPAAFVGYGLSF